MTILADAGPYISMGVSGDNNPEAGSSLFFAGQGILDPRTAYTYNPGQNFGAATCGFLGTSNVMTLNVVPYTKAVAAIAVAANPAANVPMTLVAANSATTGVSIVPSVVNALTGVTDTNGVLGFVGIDTFASVTGSIAGNILTVTAVSNANLSIGQTVVTVGGAVTGVSAVGFTIIGFGTGFGGIGTYILSGTAGTAASGTITLSAAGVLASQQSFGAAGTIRLWNPQSLLARVVAITAGAGTGANVFTIKGYDVYGFPQVEQITPAASAQTLGKKAWKYIKSVTPSATEAVTYSVDTTDIIGLPLRSDFFGDLLVNYSASLNPAIVTANTGYTAADKTVPTATTGDVRGTYTLQTASATNTNRLMVRQTPMPVNVGSAVGLYGNVNYSTGF